MGLLNYTTKISAQKSVAEVIQMLAAAGAQAVTQRFDGARNTVAIEFSISTKFGNVGFSLPVNPASVAAKLKQQAIKGAISKKFAGDVEHARRVAWRIQRQWLEAQLALIEIGSVQLEQIMLPYALHPDTGRSVYETLIDKGFERLALPPIDRVSPGRSLTLDELRQQARVESTEAMKMAKS